MTTGGEKTCTQCGKKLRAGTSFATCTKHRTKEEQQEAWRRAAEQKRIKAGGKPHKVNGSGPASSGKKPASAVTGGGFIERFKIVATALGHDADGLIEEFCEGWLANLKQAAEQAVDDDA